MEVGVCGFPAPGSLMSIEVTLAHLVAQVGLLHFYLFLTFTLFLLFRNIG